MHKMEYSSTPSWRSQQSSAFSIVLVGNQISMPSMRFYYQTWLVLLDLTGLGYEAQTESLRLRVRSEARAGMPGRKEKSAPEDPLSLHTAVVWPRIS